MTYNLKMADSYMPQIVGHILLAFIRVESRQFQILLIISMRKETSTRDKL
jgi:hypothetical protein